MAMEAAGNIHLFEELRAKLGEPTTPGTCTPPSSAASDSDASDEERQEVQAAPGSDKERVSSLFVFGVSLVTITAYSFNSYVFSWIGQAAFTSKLFHLWLCHTGSLLLTPLLFVNGTSGLRSTFAEYRPGSARPGLSLAKNCSLLAFFSMAVYYMWFVAASLVPGQILAAIFQSSIAVMYLLSVVFLGEKFSWWKATGVALAVLGVSFSSCFPAGHPDDVAQEAAAESAGSTAQLAVGICFAVLAAISQAVYKVWFKYTFGQASANFTLLLTILGGVAHIFPVLPILAAGHALGIQDSMIYLSIDSASQAGLIGLAVFISACVNVGSRSVIAMRSPIYWAAVQMLAIPQSVAFDFFLSGVRPSLGGIAGYVFIAGGFLLLSEIVNGRSLASSVGRLVRAKAA